MAKYIKTEDGYKTASEIGLITAEIVQMAQSTADSKMDMNNPSGTGSFSMNRSSYGTVGDYSHAEGLNVTASGRASHAEGVQTEASGYASHAEGYYTVAASRLQHVHGSHNIPDLDAEGMPLDKYVHIVGNGESVLSRSNAYTLDWSGVGWYQGGLQVGGNAQDDGAKNVLLEGDAIPVPETATPGQFLMVKSVDSNNKPVEWEVVSASQDGGDGLVVSYPGDGYINNLISTALGVIENGTY